MNLKELIKLENPDQPVNDNPKLFVELLEEIDVLTDEHPYGCLCEVVSYRVDDDGDIYLTI